MSDDEMSMMRKGNDSAPNDEPKQDDDAKIVRNMASSYVQRVGRSTSASVASPKRRLSVPWSRSPREKHRQPLSPRKTIRMKPSRQDSDRAKRKLRTEALFKAQAEAYNSDIAAE